MMKSPDIISELESTTSRISKESIIMREMKLGNFEFFEGLKLACNKLITFGVNDKSLPLKENNENCFNIEITFENFKDLTQKLINREVTGNSAKNLIIQFCNKCSSYDWNNWYRRILLKDLKCGVDVKTINNASKKTGLLEYSIPTFSCQLAYDSKLHESKLSGIKIIQEKLDGTRVISIVYPNGKVDQFSRNGKELLNFNKIKEQLSIFSSMIKEPMVFDGEIMSESFQALMTQLYRKTNIQTDDSILYLFDCLPLKDFELGVCNVPQTKRILELSELYSWTTSLKNIKMLDCMYADLDTEEGLRSFDVFNKKCIDSGKEGIMIKDLSAPYECKRSTAWLKLKPTLSVDLTITDLQEGEDKYKGKLGALICNGFEDEKEIFVNVGSGLTDQQREFYWLNKSDVVGKIAEIKCDAITQNQNGTYSLRFPRFVRLRGFDFNEKI